jgi:hypothetical protein
MLQYTKFFFEDELRDCRCIKTTCRTKPSTWSRPSPRQVQPHDTKVFLCLIVRRAARCPKSSSATRQRWSACTS